MKYLALAVLLMAGFESLAFAFDIPAPGPRTQPPIKADQSKVPTVGKPSETIKKLNTPQRLVIQVDEKAKSAKLIIPNSVIRALQTDVGKSSSFTPGRFIDNQPMASQMGTVIGGVLMALSVLAGGLWLVRHRKTSAPSFAVIALIVVLSGIGTASFVFANAGPPPSFTREIFQKYGFDSGEIQVETTSDSEHIILVVPHSK